MAGLMILGALSCLALTPKNASFNVRGVNSATRIQGKDRRRFLGHVLMIFPGFLLWNNRASCSNAGGITSEWRGIWNR